MLVVDDEEDVRAVLRRMLARVGHDAWDVDDGVEALKLLETISFDLVIADVYMAAVDGMELLVRIQQRGFQMPVLCSPIGRDTLVV